MTQGDRTFETVLVGVDGRPGGRDAIALAKQLADDGTRVILANVYETTHGGDAVAGADQRERARALLTHSRQDEDVTAETVVHNDRSPARGLHQLVERKHAGMLVVGSCHRGVFGRVLVGDDTLAALNGARCAVAVAPRGCASADQRLRTIAVGHDGSPESVLALEAARTLANRHGATIKVLAVVSLQSVSNGHTEPFDWTAATERAVRAERARLAAIEGVEGEVVYGDPSEELARFAENAEVLLVGSRGYGPLGRLINGSTSNYLARRSPCPLIVLPRCLTDSAPVSPAEPSRDLHAPAGPAF